MRQIFANLHPYTRTLISSGTSNSKSTRRALRFSRYCARSSTMPRAAVMDVVLVQDSIKDGDIRLDDGLIEVLDELRQLAVVFGRVAEWLSHSRLLVL